MKRAWIQIEKQLIHSPSPQYAAKEIYKVIFRKKSGVYYAGVFYNPESLQLLPDS